MAWLRTFIVGEDKKHKGLLINTDVTFAYREEPNGMASAVSIVGIAVETGEKFSELAAALEQLDDDGS